MRAPNLALDRTAPALALLLALTGCASQIPQAIRTAPAQPLTVAQAQQDPTALKGRQVRWGGTIVATTNRRETTEIEVLSRPLDSRGQPRTGGDGAGRFIARIAGFADPAEYAEDRELTVDGPLVGVETRKVGDYPYAYPVVAVETRYLWPKAPPPSAYPYSDWGHWYSPWYAPMGGPWIGPYGWPYGPGFGPWWGPWWGPW